MISVGGTKLTFLRESVLFLSMSSVAASGGELNGPAAATESRYCIDPLGSQSKAKTTGTAIEVFFPWA